MTKEKTKPFVLRLDSATMAAVEKWAADEFRSTNGQLQWIVNEALRKARMLPKHKNGGNGELSNATNDEENDNI